MLGMAFFKSLVKEHGKHFFEPIGKALQRQRHQELQSAESAARCGNCAERDGLLRQDGSSPARSTFRDHTSVPGMDSRLAAHLHFAQAMFGRLPDEISGTMVKHQLKLADRQCRMAELSSARAGHRRRCW